MTGPDILPGDVIAYSLMNKKDDAKSTSSMPVRGRTGTGRLRSGSLVLPDPRHRQPDVLRCG